MNSQASSSPPFIFIISTIFIEIWQECCFRGMRPEFVNLSEILYLFPKCKILSLFASIGLIKSSPRWFIGGGQGGGQPHSDHKITFLMLPIYHQAILPPTHHPPHPHIPPILPNPSSPPPPILGHCLEGAQPPWMHIAYTARKYCKGHKYPHSRREIFHIQLKTNCREIY